jgi:hypothetical protein
VITEIRRQAEDLGVENLLIGPLMLGIGEFVNEIVRPPSSTTELTEGGAIYRERSAWFARHPEIFPFPTVLTLHGPGLDLRIPLEADTNVYASRPTGIAAGTPFSTFFAEQWAHLSRAVGFDLLHLRDEFTTPIHAGRIGFDGTDQPARDGEIDEWTTALIELTTRIKDASPHTWLMLYSSGLSPTVERELGRVDVTRVVAESPVDAWVDQTWGGAWQDWWDAGWQGWTFQLANLMSRRALIAEGNRQRPDRPCEHYKLIQLLDGWEPYDTFHDYPGKLGWGIWAFSHAASVDATGRPVVPSGSYLAFANDRTGALLDKADVDWVAQTLDAAEASASRVSDILGPTMLVPARRTGADGDLPADRACWIEDYVGFLIKWGVPVLGAATSASPPGSSRDGWLSPAGHESHSEVLSLALGQADLLRRETRDILGLEVADTVVPPGYRRGHATSRDLHVRSWPYLPSHPAPVTVTADVSFGSEDGALLAHAGSVIWWQPPDVANPIDRRLPHYQIGTVDAHIETARLVSSALQTADRLHVTDLPPHQPATLHAWVTEDRLMVLIGNVESGWIGDSRYPREVTIGLPSGLVDRLGSENLTLPDGSQVPIEGTLATVIVPPEGYLLLQGTLKADPGAEQ